VVVLDIYKDIDEIKPIMSTPDFEGRNCYWYFRNYGLYQILDAKIMDKFMSSMWRGIDDVNCSIMDYSTSYHIINGDSESLRPNTILKTLRERMFTYNKESLHHNYKFRVWLQSMELRHAIEGCFSIFMTFIF